MINLLAIVAIGGLLLIEEQRIYFLNLNNKRLKEEIEDNKKFYKIDKDLSIQLAKSLTTLECRQERMEECKEVAK
ncbi:hypothetical protein JW813_07600 [Clostridium botulinum]|uniref:hypothetical protein n=1 Tax=Clostridium botulinum TaxID=1491 RepID=UPI0022454D50|nr:hypothetical protein [Clostridium botulinum]UZP04863.1 hypothetical protein JW813_07600 [Clostridium botulinum]UZP08274.1 hypothetical protein JYA71_07870 [Clostridium botulinum]UZP11602.1 hypothetical protein JYA74_07595 [Clostridium botulinum]